MVYCIYARKSTSGDNKQEYSLTDQIQECQTSADRLGLKVVKTYKENKSAKDSDNRPKFNEMIKDINEGVFNSIISWKPNKISRNMLESGMLLGFLKKEKIEDKVMEFDKFLELYC